MDKVKGYIDHIIYENKNNAYTVLLLITDDQEELVCVGIIPEADEGATVELEGEYVDHPSYGHQFKVSSYKEIMPDDAASIERYLGSGAIKGIGEALARRIVKKFKEDTFRIIENEPERLVEIKGISERMAQSIASQVMEKSQMRQAFIFLSQYGISNNLAVKIYTEYGDALYSVLKENPYRLAEDIAGVGFKIADDIASKMGMKADSRYRIRCGILYELAQSSRDGHVYLPKDMLIERCIDLLGVSAENIDEEIPELEIDRQIIVKGEKIYAASLFYAELSCARMLAELDISMDEDLWNSEKPKVDRIIKSVTESSNIELDELQKKAVYECIRNGVTIISGGPGTGKTTTINTIIRFFDEEGLDILLGAPTGRAAKRMQEATGYEAKTIHRLLEVSGGASDDDKRLFFGKGKDEPLEADVVIIDEMSMVDILLFKALLSAIPVGTRLVMVGDKDQLPSVGCGQVLRDLIESEAFNVVNLSRIFRQGEESDIVVNAHKINKGIEIPLDNKSKDFFFLERNDSNVIYKHMIQLIKDKLPGYVDAESFDIQVLTPMRKGTLGVETLNPILQQYLNPASPDKAECEYGDKMFREGDKVMQIKNNYQIPWEICGRHGIKIDEGQGVYNGDTGVVQHIDKYNKTLTVLYDENRRVEYTFSGLDEIELAYAVTVHKSQGSEYPAVIIPVLSGPRMLLNRNLLYTAITRARKCVTILGCRDTVIQMIHNENTNERYTSLKDRIKEVFAEDDM